MHIAARLRNFQVTFRVWDRVVMGMAFRNQVWVWHTVWAILWSLTNTFPILVARLPTYDFLIKKKLSIDVEFHAHAWPTYEKKKGQNCIAYKFSNEEVGTVLSLWNPIFNLSESRYGEKFCHEMFARKIWTMQSVSA